MKAEIEQKIASARVAGLIRAIASAENRASVAIAKGKDAAPAEREAVALRAELERVMAVAEGAEEPIVYRDLRPENIDLAAALHALRERELQQQVQALLEEEPAVAPPPEVDEEPRVIDAPRPLGVAAEQAHASVALEAEVVRQQEQLNASVPALGLAAVLPLRAAAPTAEPCDRCGTPAKLNEHGLCVPCVESMNPRRTRGREVQHAG